MSIVVNIGVSVPSQVSPALKATYNGARNAREINNFFWKFEAYIGAVGITDEV